MSTTSTLRKAGILLHPTSLPGPHGIGDMGPMAHRFVRWLAEAGARVWQVLPLVPPGAGYSPYATCAALASNPLLISLDWLQEDGLLPDRLPTPPPFSPDRVDFEGAGAYKMPLLKVAAAAVACHETLGPALVEFRREAEWIEDAALFLVLHRRFDRAWWDWEAPLRDRQPQALASAREAHREEIDLEIALQFLFDRQWKELRQQANSLGILIMGDVPIYVDQDSVDTWMHRDQFLYGPDGMADPVAGVPPDYFSETGQLWGNPIYNWTRMGDDQFGWWKSRLRRALHLFDLVRLDHFRGFSAYWAVPRDSADARPGEWFPGPGVEFFAELAREFGELPLVAEDLGDIDDDVIELRDRFGLPGMKILQFAFGDGSDHPFLPHNFPEHCVVYTGTHDNDTTLGWWLSAGPGIQDHARRYLAVAGHDIVWDLIRCALFSVARTAIFPMQDLLSLATDARMNVPGIADKNWAWRVRADAFNTSVSSRFFELVSLSGRAQSHER
ncbi:MAG: 4-alpha-glucanotransferase [Deltaproteobacteria bacterium HGW-Deltaproteobacteria-22]|nr:4-alpha-glucanotransferase [Myxococcota bacterium]PKN27401.1 MAG: 4-alpha-glucanotransferase [Deltaproteobacteria bacterium HGW-Deltaproteobacteria-22]